MSKSPAREFLETVGALDSDVLRAMPEDIVAMARAAQKDERLSDGALYGKLADEIERHRGTLLMLGSDILQDDLRELLDALDLPSGAQPRSPHEVFQQAMLVVQAQRTALKMIKATLSNQRSPVAASIIAMTDVALDAGT